MATDSSDEIYWRESRCHVLALTGTAPTLSRPWNMHTLWKQVNNCKSPHVSNWQLCDSYVLRVGVARLQSLTTVKRTNVCVTSGMTDAERWHEFSCNSGSSKTIAIRNVNMEHCLPTTWLTGWMTNFTEQSPWQANSREAAQHIQ